jgi:putative ABC transport system substrate-binding protein
MGYSGDDEQPYRRIPHFIDRILKGAKPAELPIEQVDRIELHLNLGTAKELGLTFPASLITQADRVFQ